VKRSGSVLTKAAAIVALVLTEAATIVALVLVGRAPFMRIDLHAANPVDSLMSLLRVVALAAVLWLTASTLIYLAAGARRARFPRWFTIPAIRRIVDQAIAVAIVTAAIAPPAMAADPPVIVTVDPSGMVLPPGVRVAQVHPASSLEPHMSPVSLSIVGRPTASVTVQPGDNLWKISQRHLESLGEDTPRLASYWASVVDTNRSLLRSGNPNLIYPGETVLLPPV